jgi:hypothetical protein
MSHEASYGDAVKSDRERLKHSGLAVAVSLLVQSKLVCVAYCIGASLIRGKAKMPGIGLPAANFHRPIRHQKAVRQQ